MAVVSDQMLTPVRNVLEQQLQPLGTGHELESVLERSVQLGAIDDRSAARVVSHFVEREWRPINVPGQPLARVGAGSLDLDPVMHGKAAVLPAAHAFGQQWVQAPIHYTEETYQGSQKVWPTVIRNGRFEPFEFASLKGK